MANNQIQWLTAANGDVKVFRAMVVGWQTVAETLNATVMRFNSHHFADPNDQHREMKVLAAKMAVVAALREIRLMLDKWHNKLKVLGALSQEAIAHRKAVLPILDRIHQFRDIRNCALHFGDPLEDPDELAAMYAGIQALDLDDLNAMLRALAEFGFKMRQDALLAAERLGK